MAHRRRTMSSGLLIGPGAGIGLLFGLLSGLELAVGLVLGAAVGLLIGLAVDALGDGDRHDDELHHHLMRP
jgi:hypothetical protein